MRMVMARQPGLQEKIAEQTTAEERMGETEDIGFICGFLASEEGRWINGSAVPGMFLQYRALLLVGCCTVARHTNEANSPRWDQRSFSSVG
jgi:hypothetical protein